MKKTPWLIVGLLALGTLFLAGHVLQDRARVLMTSELHDATIVGCKSKVTRGRTSRRGRSRSSRRWGYAPIAVSKSGHKAVGTKYLSSRKSCENFLGQPASIYVNASDPAKNRIGSFFQFWLFPTLILLGAGLVIFMFSAKAMTAVVVVVGLYACGHLMVEFRMFGLGAPRLEQSELSELALNQCVAEAMQKAGVDRFQIKRLLCHGRNVSDLSPISDLTQLEELYVQSNKITSLKPIRRFARLRKLSVLVNRSLTSLSGIESLTALEELRADRTQISDLRVLTNLKKLKVVDVSQSQIRDITPLSRHPALKELVLNRTLVDNIEALRSVPALQKVQFYGTPVSDIEPLFDHTQLKLVGIDRRSKVSCEQIARLRGRLAPSARLYGPKRCPGSL